MVFAREAFTGFRIFCTAVRLESIIGKSKLSCVPPKPGRKYKAKSSLPYWRTPLQIQRFIRDMPEDRWSSFPL